MQQKSCCALLSASYQRGHDVIDNIDNADENAVTSNVSLFLKALSFIGDSGSSNVRQGDVLFTVALVRQIADDADQQTENKPAREYFELRVTHDGAAVEGDDFARILSSYEIGAGDTETFAWSIEFEYGGVFEFDSVVLEHFWFPKDRNYVENPKTQY